MQRVSADLVAIKQNHKLNTKQCIKPKVLHLNSILTVSHYNTRQVGITVASYADKPGRLKY